MAGEDAMKGGGDEGTTTTTTTMQEEAGEGARQAKALDSITDHVEEKQLDAARTQEAMAALSGRTRDADREREERQRELAKVRVAQTDVDTIADEFEIEKRDAEVLLREHKGDCLAALTALVEQ